MEGGLLDGYGVKPDYVAVIVGELSVVAIVAPRVVRLEVPMNCRVRVVGVGFVHVLGRNRR